ncbi:hypothetical protein AGMMS49525_04520 [Bacteroidia bacterium]|nr:hypothetical protein AGMMS49525_04520 [Bacteroidia bacterium]
MNFENKKIEFYYFYGTKTQPERKQRVMEYHKINDIDFGFYESKKHKVLHAIHLQSGFSVIQLESEDYRKETGFKALFEKVSKMPKAKLEKVLPNTIKKIEAWGFAYPLNG